MNIEDFKRHNFKGQSTTDIAATNRPPEGSKILVMENGQITRREVFPGGHLGAVEDSWPYSAEGYDW